MNQEKDTRLIQGILNGNPESEKIFYEKYKKIVEDYLRSKYGNIDIEDDVSEIMIKVFTNLNKYIEEKSKLKSWIFTISKNHMIDKWRTSGSTINGNNTISYNIDSDNPSEEFNGTFHNTCSISDDIQVYNTTNTCVVDVDTCKSFEISDTFNNITTNLSACECILIDMKYIQGFTYSEIGNEFNLTSTTVSNKVNYIKSKLKKEYDTLNKKEKGS
jgi:RNA polymerase sigma-70 factor (ECF subfamily)